MLVVMAIILMLSLTLYPAVMRGMAKARQAQCIGHLRQIGLALQMYSLDWHDTLPYAKRHTYRDDADSIVNNLSSYIDNPDVFLCPSTEEVFRNQFQLSYVYNVSGDLLDPVNLMGRPVKSLSDSTNTWVLIDTRSPGHSQPHFKYFANVLWLDGRVEAMGP